MAVAAGVDDEEVNVEGLLDLTEEWIMGEGGSESHPGFEEKGVPSPGSSHDAVEGHLHCREQFRIESIAGSKGHMCQGASCGKRVLKRVSNCMSDKSWQQERMSAILLARP